MMTGLRRLKGIAVLLAKITGWLIAGILLLLLLVIGSLHFPVVQNYLVGKATGIVESKTGTRAAIGYIRIVFPAEVVLERTYLEDQEGDTLFYAGRLGLDAGIFGLLRKSIVIDRFTMDDFRLFVSRSENDTLFNYSFLAEAFTGEPSTDTTSSEWDFAINKIALANGHLQFDDRYTGDYYDARLGDFVLTFDDFDLNNQIFVADLISLRESGLILRPSVSSSPDTAASESPSNGNTFPQLGLKKLVLQNVDVEFNPDSASRLLANAGEIEIQPRRFSLDQQRLEIDQIRIDRTFVSYQVRASAELPDQDPIAGESGSQQNWVITLNALDLTGNSFQYENFNAQSTSASIDPNHLWIQAFSLHAGDIRYDSAGMKASVQSMKFRERGGLVLEDLSGVVALGKEALQVDNLVVATPESKLQLNASGAIPSQNDSVTWTTKPVEVSLNADIAYNDVRLFAALLPKALVDAIPSTGSLKVVSTASGTPDRLTIKEIRVNPVATTNMVLDGYVAGLPEIQQINYDVNLRELSTVRDDLALFLPDSLMQVYHVPDWLQFSGEVSGTLTRVEGELLMNSNLGSIHANGRMPIDTAIQDQSYALNVELDSLAVGTLIKNEVIGAITLSLNAEGNNLISDVPMDARFKLLLREATYNGYTYRNFMADGKLDSSFFSGIASIDDENLQMILDADLDFRDSIPHYIASLGIEFADLYALRLTERPLTVRTTFGADLQMDSSRRINGSVSVHDVVIFNGESTYTADSLLVTSIDQEEHTELSIRSDLLDGEFTGTINLLSLPGVLGNHFAKYYGTAQDRNDSSSVQNFEFDLRLKNTELLTELLLPELEPFEPGVIRGEFDSQADKLDIEVALPEITYGTIFLDSISLDVNSTRQELQAGLRLKNLRMDTLQLGTIVLNSRVAKDSILASFRILDSVSEDKMRIVASVARDQDATRLSFLQDAIILNYNKWDISPQNVTIFSESRISADQVSISHENQKIEFSTPEGSDSTFNFHFTNVDLQGITDIVSGTVPVGGIVNGNLSFGSSSDKTLTSALRIDNLAVLERTWGDLIVEMNRKAMEPYRLAVSVGGRDVNLNLEGTYDDLAVPAEADVSLTIRKLGLDVLEPFLANQMRNAEGTLAADIRLYGQVTEPEITGSLELNAIEFFSVPVGVRYAVEHEVIDVGINALTLDEFTITDDAGNSLLIDGSLDTRSLSEIGFDLTIQANEFRVLNTTEDENELFYGHATLNLDASVTGTVSRPVVDMEISPGEGSTITYTIPESEKGVVERTGVVEFIDVDSHRDTFLDSLQEASTAIKGFQGIDLTANIEVDETETFTIVIDPVTGDRLTLSGAATLALTMTPSGDIKLYGQYTIEEGSYEMALYRLVNRSFSITKGSSISWNGDLLDASLGIEAVYKVETAPIDLVSNQLTTTDPQELNRYRQRLPFLVYLSVRGDLYAPEISFRLDMPEESRNTFGGSIYAQLNDLNSRESDLNKQVFALLVLKRFISDNPFENQAGDSFASGARRSVSRLMTEQLNRFLDNVEGVDLSVNLRSYEDFSSGEAEGKTDLELGLSKSLFDERLTVRVSGNVGLEGEQARRQGAADYIGDLAIEYALTPAGNLRIKGFRNSDYDVIDGELTETGAGIIYLKDFNTLLQLFNKPGKHEENGNP